MYPRVVLVVLFVLFIQIFLNFTYADCPDWIKNENIPLCPESGITVLPETYPAMAYVVSDRIQLREIDINKYRHSEFRLSKWSRSIAEKFVFEFAKKILISSGNEIPLIFMPVSLPIFNKVQERLIMELEGDKKYANDKDQLESIKKKWLTALVRIEEMPSFTWQQDYFQSYFDPKTGLPKLQYIKSTETSLISNENFNSMMKQMKQACDKIGHSVLDLNSVSKNANHDSGGNISALPGGLCLHGTQHLGISHEYCKYIANEVEIDTTWLLVGHIDEIVAVIPNSSNIEPCNFSIVISSPRKALELMKEDLDPYFPMSYLKIERERIYDVCVPQCFSDLINRSFDASDNMLEISKLSNKDFYSKLRSNNRILTLNAAIQIKLDKSRQKIEEKLIERLPACKGKLDFIEVPELFQTDQYPTLDAKLTNENILKIIQEPSHSMSKELVELKEKFKNLQLEGCKPLLPVPANLVVSKNSILSPKTHNSAFDKYIEAEYRKRGLEYLSIDTLQYAHIGEGNLHCSTNALRICRPSK